MAIERFNWHLPLYGAIGAIVAFSANLVANPDAGMLLYLFVAIPLVTLVLIVAAMLTYDRQNRQALAIVSMFMVYCLVTWSIWRSGSDLRDIGRWFFGARHYKAEVLAQPSSSNGLKHWEWEASGFAGVANRRGYVVFDPADSLTRDVGHSTRGKLLGLPCEVDRVFRLERYWYSVEFYTDSSWEHCQ
jgi:ABC-type nickel/cobalt efflux system permease component RcnA